MQKNVYLFFILLCTYDPKCKLFQVLTENMINVLKLTVNICNEDFH